MKNKAIAIVLVSLSVIFLTAPAQAAAPAHSLITSSISMEAGHSRILKLPRAAKRVSVADEKVADVLVISPRQLYVNAKKIGSTNVTVWDQQNVISAQFTIQIGRDLTKLKETFDRLFPGEAIQVHELEGAVVISGRVSSVTTKKKAEEVAKIFEKERVSNLLEVGGQQQVLLELRFAEVNRQATKRFNINLEIDNPSFLLGTFLDALTSPTEKYFSEGELNYSDKLNGIMGGNIGGTSYLGFLDLLKQNGLAKVLAEPNLVCVSGEKANFLAGGEFPIPVPGRDYATIHFKKFGVQLTFLPEVLSDGKISLMVEPEVSELDWSAAVVTGGYTVPGLTMRKASTQLELNDGQDFAIAGLLKQDISRSVSKWPILGDIPILGALFRSTEFKRRETELLIVVAPRILKPGEREDPGQLVKKGDFAVPSDTDFFLFGDVGGSSGDVEEQFKPAKPLMEVEGKFGHEVAY